MTTEAQEPQEQQQQQQQQQQPKTPEQIEREISSTLGGGESGNPDPPMEHVEPAPTEEPKAETPKYNPLWDSLRKKLGTEENPYNLPEHILSGKKKDGSALTPDDEFEEIVEHIASNIQIEEDDPFVVAYKAEKEKPDFNMDNFVKDFRAKTNILELSSKEFMTEFLKLQAETNKTGWTDEDIDAYISKKTKIELDMEAQQGKVAYKNYLTANLTEEQKVNQQKAETARIQKINDINTAQLSRVDALVTNMSKMQTIGGIPHGQTDIDEFLPFFKEMVTLNPATGKPKITELLKKDETLYRTLYIASKLDKGALTDVKEAAKREILEKTDLQKRIEGGAQKTTKSPKSDDFVS